MKVIEKTNRPWGEFQSIVETEKYKLKKIIVEPGERLSYQSHDYRSEHWVILSGKGELTLDNKVKLVSLNEHVFIPKKIKHRIKNTGTVPLVFIEIQVGSYFGEDDITRYSDDYGRLEFAS